MLVGNDMHLCFGVREHGGTTPVAVRGSGWKALFTLGVIERGKSTFQTTPVSKVVRVGVIPTDARDRIDARMLTSVVCAAGRTMIAIVHAPTAAGASTISSLDWVRVQFRGFRLSLVTNYTLQIRVRNHKTCSDSNSNKIAKWRTITQCPLPVARWRGATSDLRSPRQDWQPEIP